MYAIVEIAGKQFRVAKNQNIKVPRLEGESGSKVNFDKVLFYSDDNGKSQIGKPGISNMAVSATIVEHGRDKKIIVFKKKRRKGYQVKNGHRQDFSVVKIDGIGASKGTAKSTAKVEAKAAPAAKAKTETKAKPKTAAKKAETKPKTAAKPKTTATKKPATAKKTAAKKATAEKTTAKKPAEKKAAKPKTTSKAKSDTKSNKDVKKATTKKKEA
ncbi:MAG: 50S ribosomal protein L21 [Calditrichaceae bacterium]